MANGATDRIGIFLDGWFLHSPELGDVIPTNVRNTINEWNIAEASLAEPVWNEPDHLPSSLREAYDSLWNNRQLRDWCLKSSVWQGLFQDTHRSAFPHLFPFGSTASRLAALLLAEWLVIGREGSYIRPSFVADESRVPMDLLIQECARETWQWLLDFRGQSILNLTLCPGELKRAYKWVAALARMRPLEENLILYDWNDHMGDLEPINVPELSHYCGSRDFFNYYLKGSNPPKPTRLSGERVKNYEDRLKDYEERMEGYKVYAGRLEEWSSKRGNEKLKLVLKTWAKWRWPEEDEPEQEQSRDGQTPQPQLSDGPTEAYA